MDYLASRARQFLCSIAFCFSLLTASAQTWTGAVSSDWSTAGNWSPAAVPTSSNGLTINSNGSNAPVVGTANATILNLYLANSTNSVVQLTVSNGFRLTSGYTQIGSTTSGTATVNVTGTGSQLAADSLYASYSGTGTLNITSGGKVTSSSGYIGRATGAHGNATIDGTGSQWIDSGTLAIGGGNSFLDSNASGTGTLTISNGGKVTNTSAAVGYLSGATGTVNVSGSGSQWASSGTINLGGFGGKGVLNISDGAAVTSAGASVSGSGNAANQSAVSLTGTGASWTNTGTLAFSGAGSGAYVNLTIGNGATLQSSGLVTLSNSVVTQSGGTFTANGGLKFNTGTIAYHLQGGTLQLGGTNGIQSGAGTYTFDLAGGTIQVTGTSLTTAVNAVLADATDTTLNTNGLGATWSGNLSGSGALTKVGAGTLTLSGTNNFSGSTTVSAGTLAAGSDTALSSTSALTVSSGATLAVGTAYAQVGSLAGAGAITFNGGALTMGADGSSTAFSGTLSGPGGIGKVGSGTLTLSGTGGETSTIVAGGKLVLANLSSQSAVGSDALSVGTSATLAGTGYVAASSTTIDGTLLPGDGAVGTLNFAHSLTFAGTGMLQFDLASGASYDQLIVGGALTTGGTLAVNFLNGYAPLAGATFHLFDTTTPIAGSFATFAFGTLGTGLIWDTSALYTAGNLSVAASPVPEPATSALLAGFAIGALVVVRRHRRV